MGCIDIQDGVPPVLGLTWQDTYNNSGGAVPTVQISAAFGRAELRGAAAVNDIMALSDDGGTDFFTWENGGDSSALAPSTRHQLGNAAGSPAQDLVKSAGGTSELRYRTAAGADTLNDKQAIHNSGESYEVNHFDGAAFDTMLRITGTNVLAPQGRLLSGDATIAFNLFELAKDIAGATQIRLNSENITRFELLQDAAHDITLEQADAAGATVAVTLYRNATGNWEYPAEVALVSDDASLQVGNALGSPRIDINKLGAEIGTLSYRTVNDIDTAGDKSIVHDVGEALDVNNFNGATFDTILSIGTADVTLPSGDLVMTNVTPNLRMGTGGGDVNILLDKGDASAINLVYQNLGFDRFFLQLDAAEDVILEVLNGAGVQVAQTFYRTADGDWEFPNNVDVAALLGVVGDVTLESDLVLDGATGNGDLTIDGSFDMASGSPTANIGSGGGSPNANINKGAGSNGVFRYRTVVGADTSGDKVWVHGPTESLVLNNHNGASLDDLITFTTTIVSNVAHNFDAAVTMDTTLLVTGNVEFDADLNHDGANLGFRGAAAAAVPAAYTVTNFSSDKVYDADATSVAELADVLGALILDMINQGLLAGTVT